MTSKHHQLPRTTYNHDEHIETLGSEHSTPNLSLQESTLVGQNIHAIPSACSGAYAEHGPGIDHKIPQAHEIPSKPHLAWSRIRHAMREPFSEFFGVFIL